MSYDSIVIADGPRFYWPLNDAVSSTTVVDATGNGFTGTVAGGVTFGVAGGAADGETAASFDGSSGVLSIPSGAPPPPVAMPVTIEFAIKAASTSPVGIFDTDPGQPNVLRNYAGGFVEWQSNDPELSMAVPDTTHFHLYQVIFRDNGSGLRHVDIYCDNNLVGSQDGTGSSASFGWPGELFFGNINGGSAGWYQGVLQKIAVYYKALNTTQIAAHYNAFLGSGTVTAGVPRRPTKHRVVRKAAPRSKVRRRVLAGGFLALTLLPRKRKRKSPVTKKPTRKRFFRRLTPYADPLTFMASIPRRIKHGLRKPKLKPPRFRSFRYSFAVVAAIVLAAVPRLRRRVRIKPVVVVTHRKPQRIVTGSALMLWVMVRRPKARKRPAPAKALPRRSRLFRYSDAIISVIVLAAVPRRRKHRPLTFPLILEASGPRESYWRRLRRRLSGLAVTPPPPVIVVEVEFISLLMIAPEFRPLVLVNPEILPAAII